jgi:hypothetical protein
VSHASWVGAAGSESPAALVARVVEVLAAHPDWEEIPTSEALLNAGAALLGSVLGQRAVAGREVALDLLAADACVTWAFEATSDEPGTLPERAERAMQRIADVAR